MRRLLAFLVVASLLTAASQAEGPGPASASAGPHLASATTIADQGDTALAAGDAALAFAPATLDFGPQFVQTSSTKRTAMLTNNGSTTVFASLRWAAPPGPSQDFNPLPRLNECSIDLPHGLAPGASCYEDLYFSPHAVGSSSAQFDIYENVVGAFGGSLLVSLPMTGQGIPLPSVTLTPASLEFGEQPANSEVGPPQTITVTNSGAQTIMGLAVAIPAEFGHEFTLSETCGALQATGLAPGASCAATVRFASMNVGHTTGMVVVSVVGTATTGPPPRYTITQAALSGTGGNPGNPRPAIANLNPTHVQAGSGAFTITVSGANFVTGAVVRWNGAPRPTTFVSGTELQAQIAASDVASSDVIDITAVNPSPGGGSSAPFAFFATPSGAPITASASGTSTDPDGAATASMGGTGSGTNGSLSATAQGAGTVTVARYAGNPGGTPNFGLGSGGEATAFLDLHVSPGNGFTTLTIVNCNLGGATTMYWWTGSAWIVASDQSPTPVGCITVTVTATSSPNLGNLTGTYVGAGIQTGPPLLFADVPITSPAYEAIKQLNARDIIRGYGDGNFGPADPTLRHQMAALIARAMPGWVDETGLPTFGDNTSDTELMTRVATLQRHNVVRGYQDDVCRERGLPAGVPCYGPLDTVKYGQVMLFIARAMVEKGYWVLQPDDRTIFPDQNGAANADLNTDQQTKDHQMIVTYVHYVQTVPDVANVHANFVLTNGQGWGDAAPRAWFARAFWPALESYFGQDTMP